MAQAAGMEAKTLVLMGRTGNGKSSTGNSIVGRNVFKTGFSFSSVTKECQLEQTKWKDGRIINVIDTPGLFDTNSTNSKEFIQNQIFKFIDLAKGGVHGVLYVVSVKNRFTSEEAGVLDSLQQLFGANIINYMVVVFTGGDDLERGNVSLEEYLNDSTPQLEGVLRRCNMRKVLFDNKTTSQTTKDKQTAELIQQIDNILAKNGGQPYSNDLLRQAQDNFEKFVSRRTCGEDSLERVNAEHIKQFNATADEKMQEIISKYEEKVAHEQAARKEAERIAQDALQMSKQLALETCERNPMQDFCNKVFDVFSRSGSGSGSCTIL